MEGEDGFMGVTGREWWVYQVNTKWLQLVYKVCLVLEMIGG